MERIKELQQLLQLFVKPVPTDQNYIERHREYLKLEQELDDAVKEYFERTGKGKLQVNGTYFK